MRSNEAQRTSEEGNSGGMSEGLLEECWNCLGKYNSIMEFYSLDRKVLGKGAQCMS